MSQVATSTEPGWQADPSGRFEWRYWDGGWTNRVANSAPADAPAAEVAPEEVDPDPTSVPGTAPAAAPDSVARVEPFGVATTTAPAPEAPAKPKRRRAPD